MALCVCSPSIDSICFRSIAATAAMASSQTCARASKTRCAARGSNPDGGKILLLTMPRLLGFAFNPLSVYYCFRMSGDLAAVLWEVDNTFGERHAYMIPVEGEGRGEIVQTCGKEFHVSPFLKMDLDYRFRLRAPDDLLNLVIEVSDDSGLLLSACYQARREPLTDRNLLRQFFATPLLPLRVMGGIHWEALKLWRKGVRLRSRPPPPSAAVTFVRAAPAVADQIWNDP